MVKEAIHRCSCLTVFPDRLVHAPLTALMMLETARLRFPTDMFERFEYRAVNPIVVNRPVRICVGPKQEGNMVQVWAEERDSKVVGMTGTITFIDPGSMARAG